METFYYLHKNEHMKIAIELHQACTMFCNPLPKIKKLLAGHSKPNIQDIQNIQHLINRTFTNLPSGHSILGYSTIHHQEHFIIRIFNNYD